MNEGLASGGLLPVHSFEIRVVGLECSLVPMVGGVGFILVASLDSDDGSVVTPDAASCCEYHVFMTRS